MGLSFNLYTTHNRTEHQHEIHPYPWSSGTLHSSPTVWKHRRRRRSESAPRGPLLQNPVSCRTEYTTLWDTEYIETETEECNTVYVNSCNTLYKKRCFNVHKQECRTVQDKQCSTVYNEVCVEKYRTEYEAYTETKCRTEYKDDCEYQWEGEGNAKVWVPIPGTCKSNPYDTCEDVPRQKERQVPYPVCNKVLEQKCVNVPKKECITVQEQKCTNEPYQKCDQVPQQDCQSVHKKVPTESAEGFPRRSVMMVQGLDMVLKHPGREV